MVSAQPRQADEMFFIGESSMHLSRVRKRADLRLSPRLRSANSLSMKSLKSAGRDAPWAKSKPISKKYNYGNYKLSPEDLCIMIRASPWEIRGLIPQPQRGGTIQRTV